MIRRRILATLANNAPKLPNGYQQIEYIENGGNSYIDTGVKATYQTRVVLDISDLTTVDTHIFGAKKADSGTASDQFSMIRRTSTTIRSDYFGTNVSADMADTITRFTIDKDANVTKINGVVAITNTAVSSGASQYNMYLFGCNTANDSSKIYPSTYKLYSCQIYDNGTLVRDFIPAMNASGEAGLYDLKNDVWYAMLPVTKPKVENKISTWNHVLSEDENYIYFQESGLQSEYPVASDITITADVLYTSQGSVVNSGSRQFTIRKGTNDTGTVLSGGYYEEISASFFPFSPITSISPTEDDTYIYTF